MSAGRGIPDDTPENIANAIRAIIEEEAGRMGLPPPEWSYKGDDAGVDVDVRNESTADWFRINLSFVDSQHTILKGAHGRGFISWGNGLTTRGMWKLQLLPNDSHTRHQSPPFIWALYRKDEDYLRTPPPSPTATLDGRLLRKLLRDGLDSQSTNT
jgi:hypothetical protein